MEDTQKLLERERLYESVCPIKTENEVPVEEYLRRLSKVERQNISHLFQNFDTLFRATMSLMALAVGTTTFSEEYWTGLSKYLQEHDPSKLEYVDRKGEDIDIIICNDNIWEPAPKSFLEWIDFTRKDLDRAGIDYIFEDGEKDCGTSYITVPVNYQVKEGQGVIRDKIRDYSDSFRILYPNSRVIHLSFCDMVGEMKLKLERIRDNHFSLLFRHSNRYSLRNLIRKVDGEK